MGLFHGKRKTIVSSTVFNLAGDNIEKFTRQAVIQSSYLEEVKNFSKNFVDCILESPGFKVRHYFYWCQKNTKGKEYCDQIGHYYSSFGSIKPESQLRIIFKDLLNLPISQNVNIDSIEIGEADYYYWGAKYLAENYPQYTDDMQYDFSCDFSLNDENNEESIITIHIYDTTPDKNEIDTLTCLATGYKNNEEYLYISYQIYDLIEHEVTSGGPDHEHTHIYYTEPDEIEENLTYVIYARHTLETDPNYNAAYATLFDLSDINDENEKNFILPPIPFRLDNHQVSNATKDNPDKWRYYQLTKRAAFKAFGDRKSYKKLDKSILENPELSKIDYVYAVFGVSLNTKNWAGKRYLYEFIEYVYSYYISKHATYIDVRAMNDGIQRMAFDYRISWTEIHKGVMGTGETFPNIPQWAKDAFIDSEKYAVCRREEEVPEEEQGTFPRIRTKKWVYFIYRKNKKATQYTYYKVNGLHHANYVHKGKTTDIDGYSAFSYELDSNNNPIYKESAFIFPLHEGLFKALPAVVQAQLSMSFGYLLFNCYERKHIAWYASSAFRIFVIVIVIIIIIIVTICTWGSGTAPATKAGVAVVSALTAAGVSLTTATLIAVFLEFLVLKVLVGLIVAKLVAAGARALGFNAAISNLIGTVAACVATWGASTAASMGTQATNLAVTAEDLLLEASSDVLIETTEEVAVETATTLATNTFTTTATTSLFELIKDGVYNFVTSPVKLLQFTMELTGSGMQGYLQEQNQKLQQKAQQIAAIQQKTEELRQQYTDLNIEWQKWAEQLTLWKIQTSIQPDDFLYISFMSSSDIIDLTIGYLDSALDPALQITYPS